MAYFSCCKLLVLLIVSIISSSSANNVLDEHFYDDSCPDLFDNVRGSVNDAIRKETRTGASLLRLHFHDCFVNGCDGSVLLDDTHTLKREKSAAPNLNSLRGFDVIDEIKASVESACPNTVSCADILAIVAMFSVSQLGGFGWRVQLGRRDSLTASQAQANKSLPSPKSDINVLISQFKAVGLNSDDLVVLSGAHTIGQAKCKNFRDRLYNESDIDPELACGLKRRCPETVGEGDDDLEPLDHYTPMKFDNDYYLGLVKDQGLLHSDQQLLRDKSMKAKVMKYNTPWNTFQTDFGNAMIKMGGIKPLTGKNGQIRKNCRRPNQR